jgi:hypothetical protein
MQRKQPEGKNIQADPKGQHHQSHHRQQNRDDNQLTGGADVKGNDGRSKGKTPGHRRRLQTGSVEV